MRDGVGQVLEVPPAHPVVLPAGAVGNPGHGCNISPRACALHISALSLYRHDIHEVLKDLVGELKPQGAPWLREQNLHWQALDMPDARGMHGVDDCRDLHGSPLLRPRLLPLWLLVVQALANTSVHI